MNGSTTFSGVSLMQNREPTMNSAVEARAGMAVGGTVVWVSWHLAERQHGSGAGIVLALLLDSGNQLRGLP